MRRSVGITLLAAFFLFGALMAALSFVGLLLPGSPLDGIWRFNPRARVTLTELGVWGIVLMLVVAIACALAAVGIWLRTSWGRRLAIGILAVNVLGDLLNAVVGGDLRTLIGIPIGGALILYLLSSRTRAEFELGSAAV